MNKLGFKIAEKRKGLGMTQIAFAEKMHVTRQTISRWEAGTAMPDIDKIGEIADILEVSCDYLLKDEVIETGAVQTKGVGKLLKNLTGNMILLSKFKLTYLGVFDTICKLFTKLFSPQLRLHMFHLC